MIAAVAVPFALVGNDAPSGVLFGGVVFGTLLLVLAAITWQLRTSPGSVARGVLFATFATGSAAFYFRGLGVVLASDPLQAFIFPTALPVGDVRGGGRVGHRGHLRIHAAAEGARRPRGLAHGHDRPAHRRLQPQHLPRDRRARDRAGAPRGQPLSIIMVDIDHFRPVNESFGNHAGDELLRKIAALIRTALRKEDMLVRYGGEEFLVLLPEVPGPGAVVVAGRIRKAVEAGPLMVEGKSVALTVSVGVSARLDEGPESIETLLARAEQALALAKQRGRNRVVALSLGRSIAA